MVLRVLIASQQLRNVDGTGGLGDVPLGMAKEPSTQGEMDIRIIMPGFTRISGMNEPQYKDVLEKRFSEPLIKLMVPFADSIREIAVHQINVPDSGGNPVVCYLLRSDEFDETMTTSDLYAVDKQGNPNKNTPARAILFSRAVVEFVRAYDEYRIDVIHCNDWNTGLIPVYMQTLYRDDPYLSRVATVYTTHNAGGNAYQGGFPVFDYHRNGRGQESLISIAGLQDSKVFVGGVSRSLYHNDMFNFTKGGIAFSDVANTVSIKYREELFTSAFAGGLERLFEELRSSFAGIVNGIDYDEWNPAADKSLTPICYSATNTVDEIIAAKLQARAVLRDWAPQGHSGPPPFAALRDDAILLGIVGRIDYQKAPILVGRVEDGVPDSPLRSVHDDIAWRTRTVIANPLEEILKRHPAVQIVILGSANDPYGQRFVALIDELAGRYPRQLLFYNGFDIGLSHLIFGATEIFLQPSQSEPCGLTQLVAMRYGAIPVVRSVGGLWDTVIDCDDPNRHSEANGFKFLEDRDNDTVMVEPIGAEIGFIAAMKRAIDVRCNVPHRWHSLIYNAVWRDSSWKAPALQYLRLYEEAVRRRITAAMFH